MTDIWDSNNTVVEMSVKSIDGHKTLEIGRTDKNDFIKRHAATDRRAGNRTGLPETENTRHLRREKDGRGGRE